MEWEHAKEYILIVFSAVITTLAGWLGFKMREQSKRHNEQEHRQDERLDILERRQSNVERNQGIIEERTKSIQASQEDVIRRMDDAHKDLRQDLKIIIGKLLDK